LKKVLFKTFAGKEIRYEKLKDWLLPLSWDSPHLNTILRDLRNSKKIEASGFSENFAFNKNPFISVPYWLKEVTHVDTILNRMD